MATETSLTLLTVASGEPAVRSLFLASGGLVGSGSIFLRVGAAGLCVFLAGFLLVGFRGFIAHNFYFGSAVDWPAA